MRNLGNWLPCYPTSVTATTSTQINVAFHVPVPPLVFDNNGSGNYPAPHQSGALSAFANGKGFEAWDVTNLGASITAISNASPIVVTTSVAHSLTTGATLSLYNISGNYTANGTWIVNVIDAHNFSLNGSAGDGAWSGGTGTVTAVPINISSVAITGSPATNVTINLAASATTHLWIAYADTADSNFLGGGFPISRCGLLHDSDPYVGLSGQANSNWALEFRWQVT